MDRTALVSCFQHTQEIAFSKELKRHTQLAICSSTVYKEGYHSHRMRPNDGKECIPYVVPGTTFAEAKCHVGQGRIAVLNFANPQTPGGGVQNGAMAQEECLCRSSNLYPCLTAEKVQKEYYEYHRTKTDHFFSDRLIYTKDVTVFKNDDPVPQMLPQSEWFHVDVITCAAPYLARRKHTNTAALKALFKGRIKNIFEAALDNSVDVLILGAFGCGAFQNSPKIVAQAFRETFDEGEYNKAFREVYFAIKPTTQSVDCCANINAFKASFFTLPYNYIGETTYIPAFALPTHQSIPELEYVHNGWGFPDMLDPEYVKESIIGCDRFTAGDWSNPNESPEQIAGRMERANQRIIAAGIDKRFCKFDPLAIAFWKWQVHNPYYRKQFSILGDSISTLEGYNPRGYALFYCGENIQKTQVAAYQDTWWGKMIDFFGGELLVNNAWSGSRVTKLPDRDTLFSSGCSDERTSSLHIREVMPDVIIVNLGTDEWARGVCPCIADRILGKDDCTDAFEDAYALMLSKLRTNYPNAEICCCTLSHTFISENSKFQFASEYGGVYIDIYNEIIRQKAAAYGCRLIDLAKYCWPYDSVDGTHPNAAGMNTIATMMIRELSGDEAARFLDCRDRMHNDLVVEQYFGEAKQLCRTCGRLAFSNTPRPQSSMLKGKNKVKYVLLPPERTAVLYSDTIKLTVQNDSKTVRINKPMVRVGRGRICCDLHIDGKPKVSRVHLNFIFENASWFVEDTNSQNGTWLNGIRIEPFVRYELQANDKIDLAHRETLIFD